MNTCYGVVVDAESRVVGETLRDLGWLADAPPLEVYVRGELEFQISGEDNGFFFRVYDSEFETSPARIASSPRSSIRFDPNVHAGAFDNPEETLQAFRTASLEISAFLRQQGLRTHAYEWLQVTRGPYEDDKMTSLE